MPLRRALLVLLLLSLLAMVLWPPPAGAAPYDVHSCRLPDETPVAAAGWHPAVSPEFVAIGVAATHDDCTAGGTFRVSVGSATVPPGAEARWTLTAPAGSTIAGFAVGRDVFSAYEPTLLSALHYTATVDGDVVEECIGTPVAGCERTSLAPLERAASGHRQLTLASAVRGSTRLQRGVRARHERTAGDLEDAGDAR